MRNVFLALGVGVFLFSSTQVSANVGEAFGFGSRIQALAGAGAAWGAGPFSAYHNPAQLSLLSDKRLELGYGLLYAHPQFTPINNVVTQNRFIADGPRTGNVDTASYRDTVGQEVGFNYRIFPDAMNLTFGAVFYAPLNQFAYMDTGEAYEPEYVLYRARTLRPQIELALGADLGKGFYAGMGAHVAFSLTSNATVFINTQANTTTSMRFTSSLKPQAAPYLGLLYSPKNGEGQNPFSLGAVVRLPVATGNSMSLNTSARVLGSLAALDLNFVALSALFYDPAALELGGSWQHSSWGRVYGQLEYQMWNKFEVPALLISQPESNVPIAAGSVPSFQYVNIFVPRVGWEIKPSEVTTVRVGYGYRPSFLSALPTGPGNYLDPPKHMLNLGVGFSFAHFLNFDIPCQLDFNLAYQALLTQHVTKNPGNEAGDLSDSMIGSPGYDAGGGVYGGGATLTLAF